jgi:DNA polymerase (family X)
MDNQAIADRLKDQARRLQKEAGNLYRVKAYRRAAEAVERLTIPVAKLVHDQGARGLQRVSGIGAHLSFVIERLVATGDFHALNTKTAENAPADDVRTLPGVGPHLAEKLWQQLRVRTVADLERAVRDNRLAPVVPGDRQRQRICDALRARREDERRRQAPAGEPGVAELLDLDAEYRRLAAAQRLPTIAPDRFNPFGESWLPLHAVRRGGWKYRVLFSNTALAHRLGRSRDWVVIYFSNDQHRGSRTVATETRGDLRGRRVVRGREEECRVYHRREREA